MVDAVFRSKETGKTLFSALLDARDAHGARTVIAEDIERVPISYRPGGGRVGRARPRAGRASRRARRMSRC